MGVTSPSHFPATAIPPQRSASPVAIVSERAGREAVWNPPGIRHRRPDRRPPLRDPGAGRNQACWQGERTGSRGHNHVRPGTTRAPRPQVQARPLLAPLSRGRPTGREDGRSAGGSVGRRDTGWRLIDPGQGHARCRRSARDPRRVRLAGCALTEPAAVPRGRASVDPSARLRASSAPVRRPRPCSRGRRTSLGGLSVLKMRLEEVQVLVGTTADLREQVGRVGVTELLRFPDRAACRVRE